MLNKYISNQIVSISMAEADAFAMEYFMKICGFNREGEKYRRMLKQGMDIKERISHWVDIKAVVSSFPGDSIQGNKAVLNGVTFECNAFQRLDPGHVAGIYIYVMTAGIYEMDDEEPILDQLYADIWGTAYVDAGIEALKNFVEKDLEQHNEGNEPVTVLDYFGPGFYGMDVDQVIKFFEVLDGGKIGVKARSNSLMLPLKSCAGFLIAVDDKTDLPPSDCKNCRAEYKNCAFCQAVIRRNER
jgi:Vitamin B12 dependent methionine synthase, activation domain.